MAARGRGMSQRIKESGVTTTDRQGPVVAAATVPGPGLFWRGPGGTAGRDRRYGSPRPATDAIDAVLLPAGDAIASTVQGRTVRQQNPHPRHSLARLAWIIARLGVWNCHYKPVGPKTMRAGRPAFAAAAAGFLIATIQQANV